MVAIEETRPTTESLNKKGRCRPLSLGHDNIDTIRPSSNSLLNYELAKTYAQVRNAKKKT